MPALLTSAPPSVGGKPLAIHSGNLKKKKPMQIVLASFLFHFLPFLQEVIWKTYQNSPDNVISFQFQLCSTIQRMSTVSSKGFRAWIEGHRPRRPVGHLSSTLQVFLHLCRRRSLLPQWAFNLPIPTPKWAVPHASKHALRLL